MMLNPSPRQTFGSGNEWGNSKVIAWSVLLRWLTFHLKTESCEILARFLRNLREGAVPLPTLQKAVKSPMFFSLLWEAPAGRDLPEAKGRCLHLRSEAVVMALLQLQTTKPPPHAYRLLRCGAGERRGRRLKESQWTVQAWGEVTVDGTTRYLRVEHTVPCVPRKSVLLHMSCYTLCDSLKRWFWESARDGWWQQCVPLRDDLEMLTQDWPVKTSNRSEPHPNRHITTLIRLRGSYRAEFNR